MVIMDARKALSEVHIQHYAFPAALRLPPDCQPARYRHEEPAPTYIPFIIEVQADEECVLPRYLQTEQGIEQEGDTGNAGEETVLFIDRTFSVGPSI